MLMFGYKSRSIYFALLVGLGVFFATVMGTQRANNDRSVTTYGTPKTRASIAYVACALVSFMGFLFLSQLVYP